MTNCFLLRLSVVVLVVFNTVSLLKQLLSQQQELMLIVLLFLRCTFLRSAYYASSCSLSPPPLSATFVKYCNYPVCLFFVTFALSRPEELGRVPCEGIAFLVPQESSLNVGSDDGGVESCLLRLPCFTCNSFLY